MLEYIRTETEKVKHKRGNYNRTVYIVPCRICGKEMRKQKTSLTTHSGYCVRCVKRQQFSPGQALLTRIKHNAKDRTSVSLTVEDVAFLQEICVCHYCGDKITWTRSSTNLDRKDPSQGYDWSNVVVCCFSCNQIKSNRLSYSEMRIAMHAVRLYRELNDQERKEFELTLLDWKGPIKCLRY